MRKLATPSFSFPDFFCKHVLSTYFLLTSLAEFQWLLSKPGAETPLRRSVNQPICAKEVQALDSILTSGLQFIFQCLNATIYLQPTPAPFLTSLSRGWVLVKPQWSPSQTQGMLLSLEAACETFAKSYSIAFVGLLGSMIILREF